jgi:hypothetical protein
MPGRVTTPRLPHYKFRQQNRQSQMKQYIYRINKADQITYVNSDWLDFARESDAYELTESSVLGTSIWDFVSGADTRLLYESIFSRLRANNNEVIIPFRCDSPTIIREMELALCSMPNECIQMVGRLLSRRERPYTPLLDPGVSRNKKEIIICSFCRRIQVTEGTWSEVEAAVVRLRAFSHSNAPRLIESVCSQCREKVSYVNAVRK